MASAILSTGQIHVAAEQFRKSEQLSDIRIIGKILIARRRALLEAYLQNSQELMDIFRSDNKAS